MTACIGTGLFIVHRLVLATDFNQRLVSCIGGADLLLTGMTL